MNETIVTFAALTEVQQIMHHQIYQKT